MGKKRSIEGLVLSNKGQDFSVDKYSMKGYDASQHDYGRRTATEFDDLENYRAARQPFLHKLANGVGKAVANTALRTGEGLAFIPASAYALMTDADKDGEVGLSDIYHNPATVLARKIDEEFIQKVAPVYESDKEKDSFWGAVSGAKLWTDKLPDGIAFMASMLFSIEGGGQLLKGGVKGLGKVSKLLNGMEEGADVASLAKSLFSGEAVGALEGMATNSSKISRGFNTLAKSAYGAVVEASMEAQGTYDHVYSNLVERRKKELGVDQLDDKETLRIKNIASSAGDANFATNGVLLTFSNALQFGKLFSGKYSNDLIKAGNIVEQEGGEFAKRQLAGMAKYYDKFKGLASPLTESFEEGSQTASDSFFTALYTDADPETTNGLNDTVNAAVKARETLFGNEGLQSMFLGAIIGGLGKGAGYVSDKVNKRMGEDAVGAKLTDEAIQFANDNTYSKSAQTLFKAVAKSQDFQQAMNGAMAAGDRFTYETLKSADFHNTVSAYTEIGKFDNLIEKLNEDKELSDEDFKQKYNIEELNYDKNDKIDSLISQAKEIKKSRDAIYGNIGHTILTNSINNNKPIAEEMRKLNHISLLHHLRNDLSVRETQLIKDFKDNHDYDYVADVTEQALVGKSLEEKNQQLKDTTDEYNKVLDKFRVVKKELAETDNIKEVQQKLELLQDELNAVSNKTMAIFNSMANTANDLTYLSLIDKQTQKVVESIKEDEVRKPKQVTNRAVFDNKMKDFKRIQRLKNEVLLFEDDYMKDGELSKRINRLIQNENAKNSLVQKFSLDTPEERVARMEQKFGRTMDENEVAQINATVGGKFNALTYNQAADDGNVLNRIPEDEDVVTEGDIFLMDIPGWKYEKSGDSWKKVDLAHNLNMGSANKKRTKNVYNPAEYKSGYRRAFVKIDKTELIDGVPYVHVRNSDNNRVTKMNMNEFQSYNPARKPSLTAEDVFYQQNAGRLIDYLYAEPNFKSKAGFDKAMENRKDGEFIPPFKEAVKVTGFLRYNALGHLVLEYKDKNGNVKHTKGGVTKYGDNFKYTPAFVIGGMQEGSGVVKIYSQAESDAFIYDNVIQFGIDILSKQLEDIKAKLEYPYNDAVIGKLEAKLDELSISINRNNGDNPQDIHDANNVKIFDATLKLIEELKASDKRAESINKGRELAIERIEREIEALNDNRNVDGAEFLEMYSAVEASKEDTKKDIGEVYDKLNEERDELNAQKNELLAINKDISSSIVQMAKAELKRELENFNTDNEVLAYLRANADTIPSSLVDRFAEYLANRNKIGEIYSAIHDKTKDAAIEAQGIRSDYTGLSNDELAFIKLQRDLFNKLKRKMTKSQYREYPKVKPFSRNYQEEGTDLEGDSFNAVMKFVTARPAFGEVAFGKTVTNTKSFVDAYNNPLPTNNNNQNSQLSFNRVITKINPNDYYFKLVTAEDKLDNFDYSPDYNGEPVYFLAVVNKSTNNVVTQLVNGKQHPAVVTMSKPEFNDTFGYRYREFFNIDDNGVETDKSNEELIDVLAQFEPLRAEYVKDLARLEEHKQAGQSVGFNINGQGFGIPINTDKANALKTVLTKEEFNELMDNSNAENPISFIYVPTADGDYSIGTTSYPVLSGVAYYVNSQTNKIIPLNTGSITETLNNTTLIESVSNALYFIQKGLKTGKGIENLNTVRENISKFIRFNKDGEFAFNYRISPDGKFAELVMGDSVVTIENADTMGDIIKDFLDKKRFNYAMQRQDTNVNLKQPIAIYGFTRDGNVKKYGDYKNYNDFVFQHGVFTANIPPANSMQYHNSYGIFNSNSIQEVEPIKGAEELGKTAKPKEAVIEPTEKQPSGKGELKSSPIYPADFEDSDISDIEKFVKSTDNINGYTVDAIINGFSDFPYDYHPHDSVLVEEHPLYDILDRVFERINGKPSSDAKKWGEVTKVEPNEPADDMLAEEPQKVNVPDIKTENKPKVEPSELNENIESENITVQPKERRKLKSKNTKEVQPITLEDTEEEPTEVQPSNGSSIDLDMSISINRNKTVSQAELNEARAKFRAKYRVNFDIVSGLIDNKAYGRVTDAGNVLISDNAPEGVTLHEEFHLVSQFLLPNAERDELYNEWRKVNNKPNATWREVEEALAEEFRHFALTKKVVKESGIISKILGKLLARLKSLIRLFNNQPLKEQLFNDIVDGKFYGMQRVNVSMSANYLDMAKGNEMTVDERKEFYKSVTHHAFNGIIKDYIDLYDKQGKVVTKAQILGNMKLNSDFMFEVLNTATKTLEDGKTVNLFQYYIQYAKEEALYEADQDHYYDFVEDNEDIINSELRNYITSSYKGTIESPELLDLHDETLDTKDSIANKPANETNEVKSAVGFLKFILNTIPNKERNRLGMTVGVNADAAAKELYTLLSNVVSYEDYSNRLLNSNSYVVQEFVNAVGLRTDGENNVVTQLNTAIFQYLSKMKNNYYSMFYDINGIPRIISNNAKKNVEDVKAKFKNNHNMALKTQDFGKVEPNGDYTIDVPVLKGLISKASTMFDKIDLMSRLGIVVDAESLGQLYMMVDETSTAADIAGYTSRYPYKNEVNELFNGLSTAIRQYEKNGNKGVFNLFGQVQSSINKLAKIEASNVKADEEFSLKNNDNKTVYSIQNHIGLTKRLDYLSNADNLDVYAKNSIWRNLIKKINVVHMFGASSQTTNTGVNADDMSNNDMFTFFFTSMMQESIYPYVFAGDKSIQYGFSVPNTVNVNNPAEMREILAGYLYDEVQARTESNRKFAEDGITIEKFNNKSLGIFDVIIRDEATRNSNNLASIISDETFKENLLSQFEEYINMLEGQYYKQLRDSNLLDSNDNFINIDLSTYSNKDTRSIVREFAKKFFIGQMEQAKLFIGNSNFYSDPSKRVPLFNSSKLNMRLDRKFLNWFNTNRKPANGNWKFGANFDSIILDDIVVPTKNTELGKTNPKYLKNEATDGQGYIHIEALRFMLDSSGLWTPTHEKAYKAEMSGQSSPENQDVIKKALGYFMAAKPQYYGFQNIGNVNVPTLYKLSVVPLFPSMVKGKKLATLYKYMTENKVSFAMYGSANKVGRKLDADGKGVSLFDKDGNFGIDTFKANKLKQTTSWRYMGIQVAMNQKPHATNNLGTQMLKIIGSNPNPFTIDLIQEHDRLLSEKSKQNVAKLYEKYNITEEGIGNREALKELLIGEAVKSNIPTNLLNAINNFTQYDIIPNRDKLEQIIMSIANNNIIKQKTAGDSKAQMSSALFDGVEKDDNLRFYEKDSKGNTRGMEVYMPAGYLGNNYKLFAKYLKPSENGIMVFKDEYLDAEGYPKRELEKLVTFIGYRIPNQSLNFIDKIIIKGFVNPELGNVIVVPYELTTKSGSDFDIDKLNLFFPTLKNGSYDSEHIDNKILETQLAILSHPSNYDNLTRPNSTDDVKPYAQKKEKELGIDSSTDQKGLFYNAVASIKRRISYLTGKNVLGQVALHITHHAQSQLHGLEFNPSYVLSKADFKVFPKFWSKFKNNNPYSLAKQTDANGKLISDILSQFADGSVDVAKGDWISSINFNTYTAGTYLMLIRLGVPYQEVIDFMSSPIIRKMVDLTINGNSISSRLENGKYKQVNPKKFTDFDNEFDREGYADAKLDYKRNTNPVGIDNVIDYLLDPVISSGEKTWNSYEQLNLLRSFRELYDLSNRLNELMKISTFDTRGGGKGIVDFDIIQRNYDKYTRQFSDDKVFINMNDMFSGYIGRFKDALIDYSNKVSNIFGYTALKRVPIVNSLMNDIAFFKGKSDSVSIAMIKANNSLIASALQNKIPNTKTEVERLLYNPFDSMAHTITAIQNGKLYPDLKHNELIKSLIPNINPNAINVLNKLGQNNVFLSDASRISVDEVDMLTDAWLEIEQAHPQLSKDLLYTTIFQSGINKTNNALTTVIPEVLIRKYFPNFLIRPQETITSDTIAKVKLRNIKTNAIVNKKEKNEDFSKGIVKLDYDGKVYTTNLNNDGKNADMVSDIADIYQDDSILKAKQLALNYLAQMPIGSNPKYKEAVDEIAVAKDIKELSEAINKLCKL